MAAKIYCNGCGEKVEPVVAADEAGQEITICVACGLPLEELPEEKELPQLDHVIVAEASPIVQKVISRVLTGEKLARMVSTCGTAEELISRVTNLFAHSLRADLIIIDVDMPGMDEAATALSIRALEEGMGIDDPTPILFFTSKRCDARFRQILSKISPAMYVNRGKDSSLSRLENLKERLKDVVIKLMEFKEKEVLEPEPSLRHPKFSV